MGWGREMEEQVTGQQLRGKLVADENAGEKLFESMRLSYSAHWLPNPHMADRVRCKALTIPTYRP